MMRVTRIGSTDEALLDPAAAAWSAIERHRIALSPSPVALAAAVSPQMALSRNHGKVTGISARFAHNGTSLAVRVAWKDPQRDDRMPDLDRFVDAAAVMFPLLGDANPLTMGDGRNPVNAWLWKADRKEPFDVVARGFGTSVRRPAETSRLAATGHYRDGGWIVVFRRPLAPPEGEFARFEPGGAARIAFAVWEGSNAERAGQKAVSNAFLALTLDR